MALHHQIVDTDAPRARLDPTADALPQAVRVRKLLKEIDHVRWTGRDFDGRPIAADPDYLVDLINRVEAGLRPHATGLLS